MLLLEQAKLLLALNIRLLRFAMDGGNAALQAAHRPIMEFAMADLLQNAAPLHFAGESIEQRIPRFPLLFTCLNSHGEQYI